MGFRLEKTRCNPITPNPYNPLVASATRSKPRAVRSFFSFFFHPSNPTEPVPNPFGLNLIHWKPAEKQLEFNPTYSNPFLPDRTHWKAILTQPNQTQPIGTYFSSNPTKSNLPKPICTSPNPLETHFNPTLPNPTRVNAIFSSLNRTLSFFLPFFNPSIKIARTDHATEPPQKMS